jgi:hypothetical protein
MRRAGRDSDCRRPPKIPAIMAAVKKDLPPAGAERGQRAARAEARDAPADAEDRRAADQARVEVAAVGRLNLPSKIGRARPKTSGSR